MTTEPPGSQPPGLDQVPPGRPAPGPAAGVDAGNPAFVAVRLGLLGVIATHALAPPRPPDGVWGVVGVLAFRPSVRLVLLAACALLLIPQVARATLAWGRRVRPSLTRHLSSVPVAVWILLLVATGWLLRCQIPYGDAQGIPDSIQAGQTINHKEPLDRLVTSLVYRVGHRLVEWDATTAIALVNTAVGGLYWLGLWWFVWRRRIAHPAPPWVAAGLLATTGATQLLFGYVESYTFMTVGLLVTLFLCIEAVEDPRRPIWPAALAYGLTFASHLAAAWLAPALVTTWALRHRGAMRRDQTPPGAMRRAFVEAGTGFAIAAAPIVLLAVGMLLSGVGLRDFSFANFGGGDGSMFVPLRAVTTRFERYTLLSGAHLAAFGNQLLLVAPVGVTVALLGWVGRRRRPDAPGWVLEAAAAGSVAYAFVFNPDMMVYFPDLGPMAEWDLLSLPALPLTFLGLWWLRPALEGDDRWSEVALPAVAVSLLHCVGWLLFNTRVQL